MIFFPGDEVRATVDGQTVTGVIQDFEYDVKAIILGTPRDTAVVRLTCAAGRLEAGTLLPLPVAALEPEMPSRIVATLTARRASGTGPRAAAFDLTSAGCVIVRFTGGGGGVLSPRDGGGSLRDFSGTSAEDCLAALRAAVAGEGWQVA